MAIVFNGGVVVRVNYDLIDDDIVKGILVYVLRDLSQDFETNADKMGRVTRVVFLQQEQAKKFGQRLSFRLGNKYSKYVTCFWKFDAFPHEPIPCDAIPREPTFVFSSSFPTVFINSPSPAILEIINGEEWGRIERGEPLVINFFVSPFERNLRDFFKEKMIALMGKEAFEASCIRVKTKGNM